MIRQTRRQRLTDRMVAALPHRTAAYFHPDPELPKHGVRVHPTGPGTFTVVTRDPFGKQRWIKIGAAAEMKIEEAREAARTVIKRVAAGLDPFELPPVKPDAVADVIAGYLKRHVEARQLRTADEIERVLTVYVLPHWHDRPFTEIKRSDVAKLLDTVEDKHGVWMADAVLAHLRGVATWYASRHDDYIPPFIRSMNWVPSEQRKRARILSDDELRRVWEAAASAGAYGALIRILLLTAQRREKAVAMRWDDVSDGVWTIRRAPREKGAPPALVLPEAALTIIHAMPRFTGTPFVLAGRGAAAPINNFSRGKEVFDQACGVTGWTLHDLRRTSRSLLSRAGVRPDIAERVLGHAVGGVEGVYDRHHFQPEMADALRKLAALIERIVNPPTGNVVVLHEAAAS